MSRQQLLQSDIENRLSNEGYILIKIYYKGNKTNRIKYRCPEGHINVVTWKNWIQGRRCRLCRLQKYAIEKRLGIKFLRAILLKDDYVLLSDTYINGKTKFEYECPNKHVHSMIWINWKKGQRCPTCRNINMSGINHPQWKGGISCEPYCDSWADKEFKKDILERDNYECQNPDCWQINNQLCLHHMDYNKKNCNPKNLITLCRSCNARANKNRDVWFKFYSKILKDGFMI